ALPSAPPLITDGRIAEATSVFRLLLAPRLNCLLGVYYGHRNLFSDLNEAEYGRYTSIGTVRRKKCRHAVLESVTAPPVDIMNKRVHLKLKRNRFADVLKRLGLTTSGRRRKKASRR